MFTHAVQVKPKQEYEPKQDTLKLIQRMTRDRLVVVETFPADDQFHRARAEHLAVHHVVRCHVYDGQEYKRSLVFEEGYFLRTHALLQDVLF